MIKPFGIKDELSVKYSMVSNVFSDVFNFFCEGIGLKSKRKSERWIGLTHFLS